MRFTSLLLAVALGWTSFCGTAMAASGTALGVDPSAEAQRKSESVTLTVGADIFIGDRIVTGGQGQVQIKFEDRTELVVGPNSALVIEDYLLRENGSAGRLAINALNGTFRFVTGGAPKDRYIVKTPTGTIGVRGTAYDLFVTKVLTEVLLYQGALEICSDGGECVVLSDTCDLGQYSSDEAVLIGQTDAVSGEDRKALRAHFRYALSQLSLLREFRIDGASRCVNREAPKGGEKSQVEPGSVGNPVTPRRPGNIVNN